MTNLLLIVSTIQYAGELNNGACSGLFQVVQHVHCESQIGLALRSEDAGRGIAFVVDKERILLANPRQRVRRIGDDGIELETFVHGLEERVAKLDIKIREVDIMQEHVDAAKVVSGRVDLLSVVFEFGISLADGLAELHEQRAGAACRVIDRVYMVVVDGSQFGEQFADLLRCVELTTGLACIAGVHLHEELICIAESVYLVILEIVGLEVHVANSDEHVGEFLIADLDGLTELGVIDCEIGEESTDVILAGRALCAGFDGAERVLEREVEVLVLASGLADVAEELRRQDEIAFLLDHLRADGLSNLVVELGIVESLDTGELLQVVDIVLHVLADKAIEDRAEDVTLELPSVDGTSQTVGDGPDGLMQFLSLLDILGHNQKFTFLSLKYLQFASILLLIDWSLME